MPAAVTWTRVHVTACRGSAQNQTNQTKHSGCTVGPVCFPRGRSPCRVRHPVHREIRGGRGGDCAREENYLCGVEHGFDRNADQWRPGGYHAFKNMGKAKFAMPPILDMHLDLGTRRVTRQVHRTGRIAAPIHSRDLAMATTHPAQVFLWSVMAVGMICTGAWTVYTHFNPAVVAGPDGPTPGQPVDPDPEPTPPPSSQVEEKTVSHTINAYGGWPNVGGDTEMDTDGNDQVPVECATELKIEGGGVMVSIYFYCEEYGGDHTTYRGTRRFEVYSPPVGKKVTKIEARGGESAQFAGSTKGQNVGFNAFAGTEGTYWKQLNYRVDGKGGDDQHRVGVGGQLEIMVTLEPVG